MSDDFFTSPGNKENPQGRDPREYPIPEDWAFAKPNTPPSPGPKRGNSPHVGAILLIVAGVLFFLNNTGILHIGSIFNFWPLILIVIGISRFGCSRGANQVAALVPFIVGVVFLIHNLGLFSLSFGLLWPIALIAVGFLFLLNRGGMMRGGFALNLPHSMQHSYDEREVHSFSFFSGVKRVMDTNDFRGGEAVAIFGGADIDLRLAQMSGEVKEVVFTANALFGGVNIKVPENWRVSVRGAGIFGGYEDKTLRRRSDVNMNSPLLVVNGFAVFGGIEVKS